MGRHNSIDTLPGGVVEQARVALSRGETIDSICDTINQAVADLGLEVTISRTAVGRFKRREEKLLQAKKRQDEFLKAFSTVTAGDDLSSDRLQVARTLTFDAFLKIADGNATAKDMANMATAMLALERSTDLARRRKQEIIAEAAKVAEGEMQKKKVPAKVIKEVVATIYGLQ